MFVDFSQPNIQGLQQPQTQQMARQQVFGVVSKSKEQQISLPSIQNSYSSKDFSLESNEKFLKPSSNKVSNMKRQFISKNMGSQSQLGNYGGSQDRQREQLSNDYRNKKSESSLSHKTNTFESHDNAFKNRTRNKFTGSNEQFHTLDQPISKKLLIDQRHSPHKNKIKAEVQEFGSAAVVKRFQGIGGTMKNQLQPLDQISQKGPKPVGQPSPTFKLNFNFQDQALDQTKTRNFGVDQGNYQTIDLVEKPNSQLNQNFSSQSLSRKQSHQIPLKIKRKSIKASNLMSSAKQIQQAALNRPIPVLPNSIKSTQIHKLSLLKRNSSIKKESQFHISEQTSGIVSTKSLDKLPKQNSLGKERSIYNESEDLRTKASSILDKYRQSQVKQSASVIEGGSLERKVTRVSSLKQSIKINLEDEQYGTSVVDLKTIIEKKEKKRRSREREKAQISKNIQDEKYATFMGQNEEDKTPASTFQPLLLDPVISFLDERKSQAWDQQDSVPTFTPVTNKNMLQGNLKNKPQVSFEDAYQDQLQRRKKSSSVEKKQKRPRPCNIPIKHNDSLLEDSLLSTKKLKKVLDHDQKRKNKLLKQKFKTSTDHQASLIKQDSICSFNENRHLDDLKNVLCQNQNQFRSINLSQELSEFEHLNKSTDDLFEDALGRSKFKRDKKLNSSVRKDEALYSQRILPFEGQNKSVFDEIQSDSTFYNKQNASVLTCINQRKNYSKQSMIKGLSCFTKQQNYSSNNLQNFVQFRTSLGSPLAGGSPTNPYNDTDPQALIKETHKTYKQIKSSANRLVRGQGDFHKVIDLVKQNSVLNQIGESRVNSSIQLCKNNQFNLKIPVLRKPAPIKLAFEYLNYQSGVQIPQSQLARMKGSINLYFSRIHYNPQINIPGTGSKEPQIRNQGQFMRCTPLKHLVITAKEDGKFEKNCHFDCEFVYITVECCDFDILDEIIMVVKAEIIQPPPRFVRPTEEGPKPTQEELAKGLKILQDFEDANNLWKGKSQEGLQEFKKNMYEMINRYQERPLEFKEFEKDVAELMKKNRGRSYSPTDNQHSSVFITDQIQSISVQDDLTYEKSKTLQEAKSRILKQLLDFGDYMEHNKLNILYSQHDIVTKQNKFIDHNQEYKIRQQHAIETKKQKEDEHHKMKLFLLHRKDILKQIKQDATEARVAKLRKEKKIKTWIVLIIQINAVKVRLWSNLRILIQKRYLWRYQKILLARIERYYKKAMSYRAPTVQQRMKQEMKLMLTVQTGLIMKHSLSKKALKLLKKFISEKFGIMTLVTKIKKYSDAVIFLQNFYRKQVNIQTGRQQALNRLCEIIKNTVMQSLMKKSNNSKNKDKLSKLVSLDEQVLQEVIDSFYSYQKIRNSIIWDYQNKLKNQEFVTKINDKIQALVKAVEEQDEHEGAEGKTSYSRDDTNSQNSENQNSKKETYKLPDSVEKLENLEVCYKFLINKAQERIQRKLDELEKLSKFLGLSAGSSTRKSSKSPPKKQKKGSKVVSLEKRAQSLNIDLNTSLKLLKWGIEIPMMKKLIELAISIQGKRKASIAKSQSKESLQEKSQEDPTGIEEGKNPKKKTQKQSPNRRLSKLPVGPSPIKTPLYDVYDLEESKEEDP